jgi:hypothetical protein
MTDEILTNLLPIAHAPKMRKTGLIVNTGGQSRWSICQNHAGRNCEIALISAISGL